MDDCCSQRWRYHRNLEKFVQGAMIVLALSALLILALAPEEHPGASVHARPPLPTNRSMGPLPVNSPNQLTKNRN